MNTRQKIENAALATSVMIAALGATMLGTWAQTRGAKQEALRSTNCNWEVTVTHGKNEALHHSEKLF